MTSNKQVYIISKSYLFSALSEELSTMSIIDDYDEKTAPSPPEVRHSAFPKSYCSLTLHNWKQLASQNMAYR